MNPEISTKFALILCDRAGNPCLMYITDGKRALSVGCAGTPFNLVLREAVERHAVPEDNVITGFLNTDWQNGKGEV